MIEAEGIRFGYGEREILSGLSLRLEEGEFLGVAGPNGAGKTTLLRILTRVLPARGGGVRLDGVEIDRLSQREISRAVAVVPQSTELLFPFQVGEIVLMGRSPHLGLFGMEGEADYAAARMAMERVGVARLAERFFFDLSGGEKQRVVLARALAQGARHLLLDEPTSALDLRHRVALVEILRDLKRTSAISVLCVMHDLDLMARLCDRLLLLKGGRVFASGAPEDVLSEANVREVFGVRAVVERGRESGALRVLPVGEA